MKKGCFISVIVFLTIILAVSFYTIKYYGDDLLSFGKDKVMNFASKKIISDLDNVENSEYSDSLKAIISNYFDNISNADLEKEIDKIEEFSQNIELIAKDSKIDSSEFIFIKRMLKKNE